MQGLQYTGLKHHDSVYVTYVIFHFTQIFNIFTFIKIHLQNQEKLNDSVSLQCTIYYAILEHHFNSFENHSCRDVKYYIKYFYVFKIVFKPFVAFRKNILMQGVCYIFIFIFKSTTYRLCYITSIYKAVGEIILKQEFQIFFY